MSAARSLLVLFVAAVAVNYAWELAQAPLYEWPGKSGNPWWHCFVASLGDGLLVLTLFGIGWLVLGHWDWFLDTGRRGYGAVAVSGLVIAVAVELVAVHGLHRWTYAGSMPLIPGLEIGLVPVLQMMVLPPVIFWIVARMSRHL